ncbi:MAG TPA: hypothetical protein ENJ35_08760 [Gammaproteobacteria bacterium]|nr:hypothetical protein [Gammaproteobacteria bacterium]
MFLVDRTCTRIPESRSDESLDKCSHPVTAYRNLSAYVLLGDPGAGKTTVFQQEAKQTGGCYVSARDLITFNDRPEWHGKILFIDGLDEIRAGSSDRRNPFDTIRARLDSLGRPRFRLSCREADWLGSADQQCLKSVSPDGEVIVLQLDPLTEEDIRQILNQDPRISDADAFLQKAEDRGLTNLLTNPQILGMLTQAVAKGDWPESRQQTFEFACQTIIREHNREHQAAASRNIKGLDEQLNGAGFLCAAHLIAGTAGYALTPDKASTLYPVLADLSFNNIGLLNDVVHTKLFKSTMAGRIEPVHRHVAEYLAARYLAGRVEHEGLPLARILSLITGKDGVVVTELRGLSAWLATLCRSCRPELIDRDPLGIVLYGDTREFAHQDKRRVLDGLQREATRYRRFRSANWTARPFGALATPAMEEDFRNILAARDRSDAHQALVDCVLDAMEHGSRFENLDALLVGIVRDPSWWPGVRKTALNILLRHSRGNRDLAGQLRALLDQINNDQIEDSDDELMGHLLAELFPEEIAAAELLNYLHTPKDAHLIGSYFMFWNHRLIEQCSESDVMALLDEFADRGDTLQPILDDFHLRDLTTGVLARGVELFGESVTPERLYDWLGLGLDKYDHPRTDARSRLDSVRTWLEVHPDIQKSIIKIGLDQCAGKKNTAFCMYSVRNRLYRATPPTDYGKWCLQQVPSASSDDIAQFLLQEAVSSIAWQQEDSGLSLDDIDDFAKNNPKYRDWLDNLLFCPLPEEWQELQEDRGRREAEKRKGKTEWMNYVRGHRTEILEARANPRLLHDLATAYLGYFFDSKGDTPAERLLNFVDGDGGLVQDILEGLRNVCWRNDIPDVNDVIRLSTEGRYYLLSRAFTAGLLELTREAEDNIFQLADDQLRKAVAIHLADGTGEDPQWYRTLLKSRPDLVSKVLMDYISAALRSNKEHISGLYSLAYDDNYAGVARWVAVPLLKSFPTRCNVRMLGSLDYLLKAGLRHGNRQELLDVLRSKLSLRSTNIAQKVHLLAAGLVAAPDIYIEPLREFVHSHKKRAQHLAGFLADRRDQWSPLNDLPVPALGLLIQILGRYFAPYSLKGGGRVTPAMNAADFVSQLINCLASDPRDAASHILTQLLSDEGLAPWHAALQHAQFQQLEARREASFRHPSIQQVVETLNNLSPANARDLAALAVEVLNELAERIRNGNTDDYRQYWNEDPRRQLTDPKHEEACRDALLSDLRQRLAPLGIDAQPEGHYADDKRADIRFSVGGAQGFEVPIEIKKNSHADLWHAIHNQLIKQYTRDPRTDGFGIYLVFWFGPESTPLPPSGSRPLTAGELEERLRATLSDEENRKISVCVIDVAKPE